MNTASGLSRIVGRLTARREETTERRRIERELAGFTTESEKAELSALLERGDIDADIRGLISDRVLATGHHAA